MGAEAFWPLQSSLVVLASCAWGSSAFRASNSIAELQAKPAVMHVTSHFWWIGVVLTMAGATLDSLGLIVQKSSHRGKEQQRYCLSYQWAAGLLIWLMGQLFYWAAAGLANQSLLAVFNCWTIIVVFVASPLSLGESIAPLAVLGAGITCVGCIWVVITGPKSYREQTAESLREGFSSSSFRCLLLPLSALAAVMRLWASQCQRRNRKAPVQLAVVSAFFDCYSVLFAKCVSVLTVTSVLSGKSQFGNWHFWAYLFVTIFMQLCQVHSVNLALKAGTALLVLPVCEALSIVGQVVVCGVFFEEFHGFATRAFVRFSLSVFSVLCGIGIMMIAHATNDHGGPVGERCAVEGMAGDDLDAS